MHGSWKVDEPRTVIRHRRTDLALDGMERGIERRKRERRGFSMFVHRGWIGGAASETCDIAWSCRKAGALPARHVYLTMIKAARGSSARKCATVR